MFDIDGVYNTQNERVYAVDRAIASTKGGKIEKCKFLTKAVV